MKRKILVFLLNILSFCGYAQLGVSKGNSFEISSVGGSTMANNLMHKQWLYRNSDGDSWFSASLHDGIAIDISFMTPQFDTRTWWERNPMTGAQAWGDQGQTMMTLVGGNLGIGTTSPSSKLELAGSFDLKYNSVDGYWLKHTDLGGNIIAGLKREGNNLLIRAFDGIGLSVGNSETKALSIAVDGNIGIGTTSPKEKLSVMGKIRAQEIKVEMSGWPDYVFRDDFKPTSLEDLERYVKINKHLPEIPSAREVETNGIALGEMNKLLLKKIEELTLHLIEQGKEIKELKNKLKN